MLCKLKQNTLKYNYSTVKNIDGKKLRQIKTAGSLAKKLGRIEVHMQLIQWGVPF